VEGSILFDIEEINEDGEISPTTEDQGNTNSQTGRGSTFDKDAQREQQRIELEMKERETYKQ
jgi:hypothetical protein